MIFVGVEPVRAKVLEEVSTFRCSGCRILYVGLTERNEHSKITKN
jgi:hypothetical protein